MRFNWGKTPATAASGKWQLTARREAAITAAAAVALNHDFWRVNNLLAASPWAGNLSRVELGARRLLGVT